MSEQQGRCQWPYGEARCAGELNALRAALKRLYEAGRAVYEPFLEGDLYSDHDRATGLLGDLRKSLEAAHPFVFPAPARAEATTK